MNGKRILIVEDDHMVADVLRDIVATLGFDAVWSSSAVEAVDMFERSPFDLVILDLELPYMNGTEVARRIRRFNPDVRIVYSTGYSDQEDQIDTDDASFCGVVRKPFELADIKAAIEKALARH